MHSNKCAYRFRASAQPKNEGLALAAFPITWFQGAKGTTSTPIGSGQTITSPVLTETTQFWARITNSCGSVDSDAATITAELARHRAARH